MERTFEMGISVKNVRMPVSCKQKWRLPGKNRLIQLYNLSVFPLMTFDWFQANLKVLGLVNESRSVPFQSDMQTQYLKYQFTHFGLYPLTIHILIS